MTYRFLPSDLPKRLRAAGLTVIEIDGWQTRGRPPSSGEFKPVGPLNHHDGRRDEAGDAADDLTWAKWMFLTGRPDLPPPLCQLALSAEGVVYVGAAGRANHAGVARPSGSVAGGDGNALYVGMEWMLSGTQKIPKAMYDAGVKVNAVLLDLFDNSVQALSCHFNTSVTGKWDIGDPDGVEYNGHKVLNVPKFRRAVADYRNPPEPDEPNLPKRRLMIDMMHASLQFSDTPRQQRRDITDLFARAKERDVWWVTGTEAGRGADPTAALLEEIGAEHGFKVFVPHLVEGMDPTIDCWVAVRRKRIDGEWEQGYESSIPSSQEIYGDLGFDSPGKMHPRWGKKGIVHVSFQNNDVGARIHVGAAHYLHNDKESRHGVEFGLLNEVLAGDIGEWATAAGRGSGLVFYGGDQNINDKFRDTFHGSPLTSLQDELENWEGTHRGGRVIDVLATYDRDARVRAEYIRSLDDEEFPQAHDHLVVEGGASVRIA